MSAPYIIPFNFQPVNTVVGTSASYTVPAGKYAIAKINISASTWLNGFGGTSSPVSGTASTPNSSSTSACLPFELILKAGDALTFTVSDASNYSGSNNGSTVTFALGAISSSVVVSLNGVLIAKITSSTSFGSFTCPTGGAGTAYIVAGNGNYSSYAISEYNQIS